MEHNFKGKRALVTGAGRGSPFLSTAGQVAICIMKGIGRTTAIRLAELGTQVIAICRIQTGLDSLKEQVPSIDTYFLDIADWDRTRSVVEQIGPIDILVNNAGVTNWKTFVDVTREELDNLYDINVMAVFNISQVVAQGMVSRGSGGAIVNVCSASGHRAFALHTIYCSSKAAIDMLTTTMAVDLGPHKIRVNSVSPGLVRTTFLGNTVFEGDQSKQDELIKKQPIARPVEKSDVADAIVYLLSDCASMVTGHCLLVDGGILKMEL